MFTKSHSDMTATLGHMINRAMQVCNYDEAAAKREVAQMVANDRRFDRIGGMTPAEVAREAFDARQSGRQIRLSKEPIEPVYDQNRRVSEAAAPVTSIWK